MDAMRAIGVQPDVEFYPDRLTAAAAYAIAVERPEHALVFLHEHHCTFALDPEDHCLCRPLIMDVRHRPVA